MSLKEKMEQYLKDLDDPNSEASIKLNKYKEKEFKKEEILKTRLNKVKNYLNKNNIDDIIERLINEHDDAYRDQCFKMGYEPYPNNKFSLLLEYIERNYSGINNKNIPQDFLCSLHFFNGYYFAVYCGQGSMHTIYDSNCKQLLSI